MKKKILIILICVFISIIICLWYSYNNSIDNKTIAILGDSIMSGYGNNDKGVDYYLSQNISSYFINVSKGGATISNNSVEDKSIINQIENINVNPDIILFNGGANDIIDYGLGFISDNLKKDIGTIYENKKKLADENTVMHDFEEIIVSIKEKYPFARLYYLQLIPIDDETINNITINEFRRMEMKERRDKLYSQIRLACYKWNIDYVDVTDVLEHSNYRQDDFIHINNEGYEIIKAQLLKIFKVK